MSEATKAIKTAMAAIPEGTWRVLQAGDVVYLIRDNVDLSARPVSIGIPL